MTSTILLSADAAQLAVKLIDAAIKRHPGAFTRAYTDLNKTGRRIKFYRLSKPAMGLAAANLNRPDADIPFVRTASDSIAQRGRRPVLDCITIVVPRDMTLAGIRALNKREAVNGLNEQAAKVVAKALTQPATRKTRPRKPVMKAREPVVDVLPNGVRRIGLSTIANDRQTLRDSLAFALRLLDDEIRRSGDQRALEDHNIACCDHAARLQALYLHGALDPDELETGMDGVLEQASVAIFG